MIRHMILDGETGHEPDANKVNSRRSTKSQLPSRRKVWRPTLWTGTICSVATSATVTSTSTDSVGEATTSASAGNEGSSAVLESVVALDDERRVFCKTGTMTCSLGLLVKGEITATRWEAGMRVRKLLAGDDMLHGDLGGSVGLQV